MSHLMARGNVSLAHSLKMTAGYVGIRPSERQQRAPVEQG